MTTIQLSTGETLLLREAELDDAAIMIQHAKRVGDETNYLSFSGDEFRKTVEEERVIIQQHRQAVNQIFLLAFIDAQLVGMGNVMATHKARGRHFAEFGLSVIKEHWGKGIGRHMIHYFIDWARRGGVIRKLNLQVQANNERAIQLYQRLGFVEEGRLARGVYVDGQFYDLVQMGLLID